MARQLRVEYQGAIYHVTVRGNAQGDIFLDDQDRRIFLSDLAKCTAAHAVRVYLYCLMTNHFHLVVETPRGGLGRFLHRLLTAYTVYFNLRHRRHGHLTQGRYGAKLVQGDTYLLNLSRYVHLNPVKVKGVAEQPLSDRRQYLRNYRWSSYREYLGLSPRQTWMAYAPMESLMDGQGRERRQRYGQFVESAIAEDDEDFKAEMARSPRCLGGEKFRNWVAEVHAGLMKGRQRPEDISFRRTRKEATAEDVFRVMAQIAGVDKDELKKRRRAWIWRSLAARLLCAQAGLTRRACAKTLGLSSGAAVSYHVRQADAAIVRDGALRKLNAKMEQRIAKP